MEPLAQSRMRQLEISLTLRILPKPEPIVQQTEDVKLMAEVVLLI